MTILFTIIIQVWYINRLPQSYRGFKEFLKILWRLQKVEGGLKETLREWKEDTED